MLCHGLLRPRPGALRLRGRILEGQLRIRARSMFGERCRVDGLGKPAQSNIVPHAHARLGPLEEPLAIIAASIVTGRQHQIRTHLQHAGHPTVYDGRYVLQEVLLLGCALGDVARAPDETPWPRPLPERHRAELALRGAYPW